MSAWNLTTLAWAIVVLASARAGAQPSAPADETSDESRYEESIDVVGVTPIRGLGIPRDQVPANVQTSTAADLESTGGVQLGDSLARRFGNVGTAEAQGNPFQPDVQVRGFTLSPLLGLPQGVAVFQDGVRVNEPFGDTLHWDLLPDNAIATVDLMPGSNPLFGRNALGGAIAIQTRTGWTGAESGVAAHAGSFGRRWLEGETGGHGDRAGWFAAGRLLDEDGWRDHSPSEVRQAFASLEARGDRGRLDATLTVAGNELIGNGALPLDLLEEDRDAVFTHPDETGNEVAMLTLRGDRAFGDTLVLEGTLFHRPVSIDTFNGDDTPYEACTASGLEDFLCVEGEDDEPIHDRDGDLIEEDDDLDAVQNRSSTDTDGWGLALQLTSTRSLGERDNQLLLGAGFDPARSRYRSGTELASLSADRGTIGTGVFDADAAVGLDATIEHGSLWIADFLTLTPRLAVMGAARYNRSDVELRDRIGTELDGDHRFTRFDPSVGLTWQATGDVTVFGAFAVSSRTPAPSELSCADPEDPCRLPNAFVADPPLEQVVARTFEAGARGRLGGIAWSGAVFRTVNRDDIVFVSSGAATNEGHFENIDETRRQGLETSAGGAIGSRWRWQVSYSLLEAEYRTPLVLSSPNHPEAVDGQIEVEAGDALPGIPRHQLVASLQWSAPKTSVLAGFVHASSRYLRGDEANRLPAIDGYTTADLAASYELRKGIRLAARVSNLFDTEFETFGLLGDAEDVLGEAYDDPRFLTPAAPRAAWLGIEVSWR